MNNMKAIGILVFCVTLISQICAQSSEPLMFGPQERNKWGIETNGLQCSLQCTKPEILEGQPAQLILKVRNVSKTTRKYHISSCCGPTFKVIASFRNGQVMNFADLEQQEHHPHPVTHWIELQPEKMNEHKYDLRIAQFLREKYLFIDPELGAPLDQYGELSLKFIINNVESNTVEIQVKESPNNGM